LTSIDFNPEALLATLVDSEVAFIVVGALAMGPHGVIRASDDLDVVPSPDRPNLQRLAVALARLEAYPVSADVTRLGTTVDATALSWGGNWLLETIHGPLHVVQSLEGMPPFDDLRTRAVEVEIDGRTILICGYEDLVAMKRRANRDQDRIDLKDLEAARGED
jgi:hypothetical protein